MRTGGTNPRHPNVGAAFAPETCQSERFQPQPNAQALRRMLQIVQPLQGALDLVEGR